VLEATAISVRFDAVRAVEAVSFSVETDEVLAIIGPNGSGKSTLLNAINGLVRASGEVKIDDVAIPLGRPVAMRRAGVLRTFQTPQVLEELTVLENAMLAVEPADGGGLVGAWFFRRRMLSSEARRATAARAALERVGLLALEDRPGSSLAYGERRKLEIARVIAGRPKMLLMDEPSAGLNGAETRELGELIAGIRALSVGIVIVDHKVDFLMALSDKMMVLRQGKAIASGRPDEVIALPEVTEAYLGHRNHSVAAALGARRAGHEDGAPVLEVRDVSVSYGPVQAVLGVSFQMGREVVGLLGANGAGKSSLLGAISGINPCQGGASFFGSMLDGESPESRARRGLIQVPEGRRIFGELTVMENIAMGSIARQERFPTFTLDDVLRLFPRIHDKRDAKGWMLSGGEQQMVAIARALMAAPRLLLLDEPSLGLAPIMVDAVVEALAQIREHVPILLVEQDTSLAMELCDRAMIMAGGRIVAQGLAAEIADRTDILDRYLGIDAVEHAERLHDTLPASRTSG
jgi:ABC-type branched-subunit amino acid transport system ATPase component